MTKYYRVRTQEQWDWLMQWFEEKGTHWITGSEPTKTGDFNLYGSETVVHYGEHYLTMSNIYFYRIQNINDFIEVSQMMEDEKMEDYVTIQGEDLKNVEMFCGNELKGNLR